MHRQTLQRLKMDALNVLLEQTKKKDKARIRNPFCLIFGSFRRAFYMASG